MLDDNSPCANGGVSFTDSLLFYIFGPELSGLLPEFLPEFDLKGSDRIYDSGNGGIIDIGAYETGNNPPYDIILTYADTTITYPDSTLGIPENEAPGFFVGTLSSLDLDLADEHSYELLNECGLELLGANGDSVYTTETFNFEEALYNGEIETEDRPTNGMESQPARKTVQINTLNANSSTGSREGYDEIEPNNTPTDEGVLLIGNGCHYAELDPEEDVDFWSFYALEGVDLHCETWFEAFWDDRNGADLTLYASDGTTILEDDEYSSSAGYSWLDNFIMSYTSMEL